MNPELTIIIVSWNVREYLRECLKSVYEKVHGVDYEVYVVDNASSDRTQEMLRDAFPTVKVIANKENMGFGKACNYAVKLSKGERLLFLNPDTQIVSADFRRFFQALEERSHIGAIVPLVYEKEGRLRYRVIRTIPRIRDVFNHYIFHQRLFFKSPERVSLTKAQVHEYPSGSCFLINRSVFERVGGFDEHYFLFYEDTDLGVRLNNLNLKCVSLPEFKIIHRAGKSTEQNLLCAILTNHQSCLYFFRRNRGAGSYTAVKVILIASALTEIIWGTVKCVLRLRSVSASERLISHYVKIAKWHLRHSI